MELDEKEILLQKFTEANRKLLMVNEQLEAANRKLKEYEEKARKAEKASKMKSLFLANMSHEIRTPLNAIEGFARIIAETDSVEERFNFLEIIESNNSRLLNLINEILDLSRVESGEIVIKNAPVELGSLFKTIKQLFKFRCPDNVSLLCSKPTMSVTFDTDENRLVQVLSNLISNALKHTSHGSIKYGYNLDEENSTITFFVADTGSGIDPSVIDTIFDPYVSMDAEQQNGYGLGLPLSRIIVERMGGTISVESQLGQGSTFTFTLPFRGTIGGVSTGATRTTTSVRSVRIHENQPGGKNQKTILVAEDEESNFELVRIVLQKRFRLLRAHNGIEAVTINEEEHPDLILMDIRMPEMNGLDATRIIKEVSHETPVIALSAYAFDENIREAKAAGCDEFMAKPFRVEALIEMCERYTAD